VGKEFLLPKLPLGNLTHQYAFHENNLHNVKDFLNQFTHTWTHLCSLYISYMQNISQSHCTLNARNKHLHSEYRKAIKEKNGAQTKILNPSHKFHAASNKTNYKLWV
jgi:hypothetical protein